MKPILYITIVASQIAISNPLCAWANGEQLDKGKYEITCEGAKVTIRANGANAAELLQDFSKKSGVTFNKYVAKRETVTLDLNSVTMEEFLNKVLGSYVATSKKKNGITQISKVTIMDEEENVAPPPRVKDGSKERPQRPSRKERASSRRRRRRATRSFRSRRPEPPKPREKPAEEPTDESQPPPADQPSEEAEQIPPGQESEEQPEDQPGPL